MAWRSILVALVGVVTTVEGYTPNKAGSSGLYTINPPYDQSFQEGYSILKHVGHLGPYSNRASFGIGRDPPGGCVVDQVLMLRRHGERFPLTEDTDNMIKALRKMHGSVDGAWRDDLEFLNRWEFYIPDLGYVGLETQSGPYNGLLGSYKLGAKYRVRYGHLFNQNANTTVPIFTAEFERVIQTARKFGRYFPSRLRLL